MAITVEMLESELKSLMKIKYGKAMSDDHFLRYEVQENGKHSIRIVFVNEDKNEETQGLFLSSDLFSLFITVRAYQDGFLEAMEKVENSIWSIRNRAR